MERRLDKKVQMMDAGTALFEMKGSFGSALGQIKAEMREYGTVFHEDDELVVDFSTIWRKRFISCHLEDAGLVGHNEDGEEIRRYAAVFKEGNRSTVFRACVHIFLASALIIGNTLIHFMFPELANFVFSLLSTVLAVLIIYRWIVPSRKAIATLKTLQKKIGEIK